MIRLLRVFGFFAFVLSMHAQRMEFLWPTPSKAFMEGKSYETFIQPTASGVAESGLFGSVRSGGAQFHEGLDIKPVTRDRRGEAADPVCASMPGIVRHISRVAGNSNYGRYVVIEHPDQQPAVYTLYAHLASIDPGIAVGEQVRAGEVLGVMGRSSSGQAIPRDRAHLHFEIGLALTQSFQPWYDAKKFGSKNDHGMWNGMNLVGIDPLDFLTQWRERRVDNVLEYLRAQPEAVRVRVSTMKIPDFVRRYPQLLTKALDASGIVAGWEIGFANTGFPLRLTPLSGLEVAALPKSDFVVVSADEALLRKCRGKHLAIRRGAGWSIAKDLKNNLDLLFGVR